MKIEKFNSARLLNAEQLSLTSDVIRIAETYDWAGANVQNLLTWVQDGYTELGNQVNKLGTVNETQVVKLADNAFNDSWRALKYMVKACLLSPVDTERTNAAIISELINSHGNNLHRQSYQVQNATAKLLLNDCINKPNIREAIAVLKLSSYVTNLDVALDTLLAAISVRKNKKVSEVNEDETREIRIRLTASLIKMFKYLEVMSAITPGGNLIP